MVYLVNLVRWATQLTRYKLLDSARIVGYILTMDYTADFLPWLRANIARWGKSREYIETYLDWYELQKLHVSDPMCLGSLAEACNLPGHPMAHERRLIPVAMGMKNRSRFSLASGLTGVIRPARRHLAGYPLVD